MKISRLVFCSLFISLCLFAQEKDKSSSGKMGYDDSSSFQKPESPSKRPPANPEGNSPDQPNLQQMVQNNLRMLNAVRSNPQIKTMIISMMKEKMTSKGVPDADSKVSAVSKVIDEVLSMSAGDFEKKQQQLAQRIVDQITNSSDEQNRQPQYGDRQKNNSVIRWIDVHDHFIADKKDFKGAVASALNVMKESNISRMIFMPPPQTESNQSYECDNFISAIRAYPEQFSFIGGGGSLNVMIQQYSKQTTVSDSIKQRFEQEANSIIKKGAVGFGEIAIHHISHTDRHPYENVNADHPLLLLLADTAAKHDVPIDIHFDVVTQDMDRPDWLMSPPNPNKFRKNIDAFERFLAHNPNAKICWDHAGTDMLGCWTAELSRRLLQKYPNLYISLRIGPAAHAPQNGLFTNDNQLNPDWLQLLNDFQDRFVIGEDQFIAASAKNSPDKSRKDSPADSFAKKAPRAREMTKNFLRLLPEELAQKIAYENAVTLYKLKD